jgi:hypothetical protein
MLERVRNPVNAINRRQHVLCAAFTDGCAADATTRVHFRFFDQCTFSRAMDCRPGVQKNVTGTSSVWSVASRFDRGKLAAWLRRLRRTCACHHHHERPAV